MTQKYYLQNLLLGALLAAIFFYGWYEHNDRFAAVAIFSAVNAVFFPLSRLLLESVALKYTRRDMWLRGFFVETPAKSGLYAIYFLFLFIFALPFALIYVIAAARKGPG